MKLYLLLVPTALVLTVGRIEAANDRSYDAVDKIQVSFAAVSTPFFSPNGDGVLDQATIQLNVEVSGSDGVSGQGKARPYVDGELNFEGEAASFILPFTQPIPTGQKGATVWIEVAWDGSDGSRIVPDGDYQVTYTVRKVLVTPGGQRITKDKISGSAGATRVDTTPPQVGIISPTDGFLTRALPVQVRVQAMDANEIVSVTVADTPADRDGDYFAVDLTLPEGRNSLVAAAVDAAGNRASYQMPAKCTALSLQKYSAGYINDADVGTNINQMQFIGTGWNYGAEGSALAT